MTKQLVGSDVGADPFQKSLDFSMDWRGAGVVERGGLENRCTLWVPWVRIPPPPPVFCINLLINNNFFRYALHLPIKQPICRTALLTENWLKFGILANGLGLGRAG